MDFTVACVFWNQFTIRLGLQALVTLASKQTPHGSDSLGTRVER